VDGGVRDPVGHTQALAHDILGFCTAEGSTQPLMADKTQMDTFYKECLRFGCLEVPPAPRSPALPALQRWALDGNTRTRTQGFKHFSLYLRGREELLVTVHHAGASEAPVDSRKCAEPPSPRLAHPKHEGLRAMPSSTRPDQTTAATLRSSLPLREFAPLTAVGWIIEQGGGCPHSQAQRLVRHQ